MASKRDLRSRGTTEHFSLVVTVWEHDQGDPDAYREEVETLVSKAIEAAKIYNEPVGEVLEMFEETIVDLFNALLGTGDDLLTTETALFTREQMEQIAMSEPGLGDTKHILYHFDTTHKADGATYVVCFDVDRDPARPPHIIL